MEFRYRAIDSDRPTPAMDDKGPSQSPKPNFSFSSAPSIPGASEVDVHEAIRRELEKEQILLQIIIAEASRKRDLIAEVLQDMSMERELATRRVSDTGISKLEEKLTLLINQMKHPNLNQNQNPDTTLFKQKCNYIDPKMYSGSYNSLLNSAMMLLPQLQQMHEPTGTSAMTSNNEKLAVLNRADTIGAKHGTMQLPQLQLMHEATGTSALESNKEKLIVLARSDSVGAKRKAEDTETGMNKNLEGKKQKAEEGVLEGKTMSVKTGEIVSSKVPCLREVGSGKEVESKWRSSFRFWCEICGVGAFSERVMRNHELGKKHMAAVTQRNEAVETAPSSLSPASVTAQQAEAIIECENGNQKGDEMSKKTESEKGWLRCETCNVKTNSEELMRYHKLGKKHRKKQRLLYEEGKTIVIED